MRHRGDPDRGGKIVVHVDADYEELVPRFLENRRRDVTAMLDALDQGDYETIRLLGHSMKGTGAAYGFEAIAEIGAQLEEAAQDKDAEEIRRASAELSAFLDRLEVVYE